MDGIFKEERLKTVRHACDVDIACKILGEGTIVNIILKWDSFLESRYIQYDRLVPELEVWLTNLSVCAKCIPIITNQIVEKANELLIKQKKGEQ